MQRIPIAVLGASGYSGIEATRILAQHPRADLRVVASDRWQGETVEKRAGVRGPAGRLRYAPQERAAELARECAAALLCTPVDASLQLAPALLAASGKRSDGRGWWRTRAATPPRRPSRWSRCSAPACWRRGRRSSTPPRAPPAPGARRPRR